MHVSHVCRQCVLVVGRLNCNVCIELLSLLEMLRRIEMDFIAIVRNEKVFSGLCGCEIVPIEN